MPLLDQFSMVHECGSSCKLDNAEFVQNIEREQIVTTQCIFRHVWTVSFVIMCTALYNEFENNFARTFRTGSI